MNSKKEKMRTNIVEKRDIAEERIKKEIGTEKQNKSKEIKEKWSRKKTRQTKAKNKEVAH